MEPGAPLVGALEDLLLHERLGEAHVGGPLHLPLDQHRVERTAAVVGDPDLLDRHESGLGVDLDFGDVRREGVGRRGADRGAAVAPVHVPGRVVGTRGAQGAELRLGQVERFAQRHAGARVARHDRESAGQQHLAWFRAPRLGHRFLHHRLDPPGSVDAGVAEHERHPRRVGAQVDRGEVGVARKHADVFQRDAQLLGDDVRHHGVDALADLGGAREDRDAPGAVDLQLDAGLGHVVRVDGVVGAGDVGRARDAHAAPVGEAAVLPSPFAGALHGVQALQEAVRGDAQVVDGARVGADEVAPAQLDRVDLQGFGDAVELHLEGEAWLDRTVPALGPARRLVGVGARGVEAVGGHVVGRREELAGVVGRHQPEGGVRAAVHDDPGVHGGEHAVAGGARPVAHVEGVASAVGVEDLLAGVEDLDRPAGHHRQSGHAELEVEGLGLAAERAADGRLHDAHAGGVEFQDARQFAVQVVGDLRGRPHRESAVRLRKPDGAVRLDGRVGGSLEEVVALDYKIRPLESVIHIAECEFDRLCDVAVPALFARLVDERAIGGDRLVRIEVGGQLLVLDVDQREGRVGGVLVDRRDRGHPVAHVADLVDAQRILVRRPGDDAVGGGHVPARHHSVHAFERLGPGGIDGDDAGVGVRAAQDLAVQHSGEADVVGVAGATGTLGASVDLAHRATDRGQRRGSVGIPSRSVRRRRLRVRPWLTHPRRRHDGARPTPAHRSLSLAAAASTAS